MNLDLMKRLKKYYCYAYEFVLLTILIFIPALFISTSVRKILDESLVSRSIVWILPIFLLNLVIFLKFRRSIHGLFVWNKTKSGYIYYFVYFVVLSSLLFRLGVLILMMVGLIIVYGVEEVLIEGFQDFWRKTLTYTIIEFSIPIFTVIYLWFNQVEKIEDSGGEDEEEIPVEYEVKRLERKPVIVTIRSGS